MRLAEFQQRFQAAVVAPKLATTDARLGIKTAPAACMAHRIAIHHTHFWTRMHDYAAFRYPLLLRYLGDIEFTEIVRDYIAACPPTSFTVSAIVENLVAFLGHEPPWSSSPMLSHLAAFDFQRSALRFYGEEATISAHDLRGLEHEALARVRLRLKKRAMVTTTQLDLRPDRIRELPRAAQLDEEPTYWLVHIGRRGLVTKKIDRRVYAATQRLETGSTIGELFHELTATGLTTAEIDTFMDGCLREELLVEIA